jgi:hypothetical protein
MEDCEHVNLTDSFMVGNDFLITSDQEFPLPEGTLPSWAQISVTKTHVSWQISVGDDWLETHALSMAVLEKIAGATDEERGMVMLAPEVMAAMQQLGEMGHA